MQNNRRFGRIRVPLIAGSIVVVACGAGAAKLVHRAQHVSLSCHLSVAPCHSEKIPVAGALQPGGLWDEANRGDLAGVRRTLSAHPSLVNAREKSGGNTALNLAVAGGHLAVVRYLIAHGADVNRLDARDNTPLHMALVWGGSRPNRLPMVDLLLAHGANVNARTRYGMTPLHYAVQFAHDPPIIKLLLARGADVNARDVGGTSVLQHAQRHAPADVTRLLIQAGATG